MIKVGDKEIVFSETFIIETGDGAGGMTQVHDIPVGIVLVFKSAMPPLGPKYSFNIKENIIHFEFTNWVNAATKHPVHIGKVGDIPIGFMMTHQRVGEVNLVHFQLLSGGKYEE
jgi:predicted cation transporter